MKLAFEAKDDDGGNGNSQGRGRNGKLRVVAPTSPAQTVPGVYMLYVLDKNGVPSIARQVRIDPDPRGPTTKFR